MYLRFVTVDRDERSGRATGIFTALYALEKSGALAAHELAWFHDAEAWLNAHLPAPNEAARAEPKMISWIRASATEHVAQLRALVALLAEKNVAVQELHTTRPGYIVYEDAWQVAAVPFADTMK